MCVREREQRKLNEATQPRGVQKGESLEFQKHTYNYFFFSPAEKEDETIKLKAMFSLSSLRLFAN